MDYSRLTVSEIARGLNAVADDATRTFAPLDPQQLNWRPDAGRWSVAQCLDHLLTTNRLMMTAMTAALDEHAPRSLWQRLPLWPGLLGPLMVRSLSPQGTRKFKAPAAGQPAASDIAPDIVERFAEQQRHAAADFGALDDGRAGRVIMTSPFAGMVTYSVLDACRLVLAHDCRHVEQARRVLQAPQFPASRPMA